MPPSSGCHAPPTVSSAKRISQVKKSFTLKTQLLTDGEHHIVAISEAVPGKTHDKNLSDHLQTVARLPDGCEADADKGYQGLAEQVSQVTVTDPETGAEQLVPRLAVKTPFKKPRGKELPQEHQAFNTELSKVRVRIEHCLGWIKNWAVIATRFRCAHKIYTAILRTVCGLVNAQTQRWQAAKMACCA
jgi:DDE superfamily endonuclease